MKSLSEELASIYQSIVDSNIPEEYRQFAFQWALTNRTCSAQSANSSHAEAPSKAENPTNFSELARRLGISELQVNDMLELEDDSVRLTVSSKQLSERKSQATREVALLLGAANCVLLGKQDTSFNEVRRATEYLGCFDSPNFAKQMKQMDSLIKIKKSGRNAEYSLKQPGWEEAMAVAQKIWGQQ